jgi:antitoxin component YwqK of YwqJK toxin-antitoxin module
MADDSNSQQSSSKFTKDIIKSHRERNIDTAYLTDDSSKAKKTNSIQREEFQMEKPHQGLKEELAAQKAAMQAQMAEAQAATGKGKMTIYKDGIQVNEVPKDGLYTIKQGEKTIEAFYANSKKNGQCKIYNSNKILILSAHYKDDQMDGAVSQYADNGQLFMEANYAKGSLNGISTVYYQNGMKMSVTNYQSGVQHGELLVYDEFGDLVQQSYYKNGQQDGVCKNYYSKSMGGGVSLVSHYRDGKLVDEKKMFYSTGEVFQRTRYNDGKAIEYPENIDKKGKPMVDPANKNRV